MLVPRMYELSEITLRSGYSAEQIFDLGIAEAIDFLVVVAGLGACRVPGLALSHFMAGAFAYAADEMPEHYSGAISGPWEIKRESLRVSAESWNRWTDIGKELGSVISSDESTGGDGLLTCTQDDESGLTTREISLIFDNVGGKSDVQWRQVLGDTNNSPWLQPALVSRGTRGTSSRWNPAKLGDLLMETGRADYSTVNKLFMHDKQLNPWLADWQEIVNEKGWRGRRR